MRPFSNIIIDNTPNYEVAITREGGLTLYAKRKDIEVFLQPGDDANEFLNAREQFGDSEHFEYLLGSLIEEYLPC